MSNPTPAKGLSPQRFDQNPVPKKRNKWARKTPFELAVEALLKLSLRDFIAFEKTVANYKIHLMDGLQKGKAGEFKADNNGG